MSPMPSPRPKSLVGVSPFGCQRCWYRASTKTRNGFQSYPSAPDTMGEKIPRFPFPRKRSYVTASNARPAVK